MASPVDSSSRLQATQQHFGAVDDEYPHRAGAHANNFGDVTADAPFRTHRAGARARNSGEVSADPEGDVQGAEADAISSALQCLLGVADRYAHAYARANKFARPAVAVPIRHIRPMPSRVVCGARRRRDGKPCEALSVPGKRRCKWHGGQSTGPRTTEGKAKVAANLPHRQKQEPNT